MKAFFVMTALLVTTCMVTAQTGDEATVRAVLQAQVQAWNSGNLEKFMEGYWQSDSLLFVGKRGPTYGYKNTLENYKKGYPSQEAMGTLSFDILEMKRLSVMYFFVLGKFHLKRTIGDAEGYFTLLFKRVKGKWVIVADHSS